MSVDLLTVDEIAPLPGPGMIVGDELLEVGPSWWRPSSRNLRGAPRSSTIPISGSRPRRSPCRRSLEARCWRACSTQPSTSGGEEEQRRDRRGAVGIGYETMQRLGFIDGSVPLDEMIVTDLVAARLRAAASTSWRRTIIGVTGPMPRTRA